MARPVKWSRDLYPIRERARRARTETWSRNDIEELFDIGRASAQPLMKPLGDARSGRRRAGLCDPAARCQSVRAYWSRPVVQRAARARVSASKFSSVVGVGTEALSASADS